MLDELVGVGLGQLLGEVAGRGELDFDGRFLGVWAGEFGEETPAGAVTGEMVEAEVGGDALEPTAGGWLKRVATNLSLNHLSRYRARWRFFSELGGARGEEEEREVEFAAPGDLGEELARADAHALVEQALQTLPTAQRVPLVLYHLEGLRYEEIAVRLNVSLAKVKTDIFRGREALRKKLAPLLADTP